MNLSLVSWALVTVCNCCANWGVIALHQVHLVKGSSNHMSGVWSSLAIKVKLIKVVRAMNYWVACIGGFLLIWMEIVICSSIVTFSTFELVIIGAWNTIQGTMVWSNIYLRSSLVVLSSTTCRPISIITCIERMTSSNLRLTNSIFVI